jgi:hypothetical protein
MPPLFRPPAFVANWFGPVGVMFLVRLCRLFQEKGR